MLSQHKDKLIGLGALLLLINFGILPYFRNAASLVEYQQSWSISLDKKDQYLFIDSSFILINDLVLYKYDLHTGKEMASKAAPVDSAEYIELLILERDIYYVLDNNRLVKINLNTLQKEWEYAYPSNYFIPIIDKFGDLIALQYGYPIDDEEALGDYYEFIDNKTGTLSKSLVYQNSDSLLVGVESLIRDEKELAWDSLYLFEKVGCFYDHHQNKIFQSLLASDEKVEFKIIDAQNISIVSQSAELPNKLSHHKFSKGRHRFKNDTSSDIQVSSIPIFPLTHSALGSNIYLDHFRYFDHEEWLVTACSKKSTYTSANQKYSMGKELHTFLRKSALTKQSHLETEIATTPTPFIAKNYFVGRSTVVYTKPQLKVLQLGTWKSHFLNFSDHTIIKKIHADDQNIYIVTPSKLYAVPLDFTQQ